MSPRKACATHGAANCARCAATRRANRPARRSYSDTAEYRQMLVDVRATYGELCAYCGGQTSPDDTDDPQVLAHVVAHADGGEFVLENLRIAHRSCNASAGKAPLEVPHG